VSDNSVSNIGGEGRSVEGEIALRPADYPRTGPAAAAHFVEWLGHAVITTITPDRGGTPTYHLQSPEEVRRFVAEESGKKGIYYTHARVRSDVRQKPKKEHLLGTQFLHADLDAPMHLTPAEIDTWIAETLERVRRQSDVPPPSYIGCSGNGLHLLWRLDRFFKLDGSKEGIDLIESRTRGIRVGLKADPGTHNIDRILRIPGSINLPNKKKRDCGRVRRDTSIIELNDLAYPLEAFPQVWGDEHPSPAENAVPAAGQGKPQVERGEPVPLADPDELDPWSVGVDVKTIIIHGDDPDDSTRWDGDRSAPLFWVCCELYRRGVPPERIVGIIIDDTWGISAHVLDKGQRNVLDYAWRQFDRAKADVDRKPRHDRPRIIFRESELPRVLDEAEAALIASDAPIYQQSGRLVQPVTIGATGMGDDQVRRSAGSLVIHDLNEYRLLEYFTDAAVFVRQTMNAKGKLVEAEIGPPLRVAKHYAARVGAWRLPELAGISTIPTMREDGTIAAGDGYDPASRLIIDKQGVTFPPVPDAPMRNDALQALKLLIDPISEFPFVQDDEDADPCGSEPCASRSAALSMMLTAVARHAIGAAPIFGLSAPSMETGKSLLADIPAMMVTGRRAAMISQGDSEEEDAKRLLSILMRGDPVNVIDNITREVSGDALATIITEEKWSQRWLGQNKMIDVSTKALFIANGNNLVFREDMAVRALMVSLDARMERPGERRFDRDLRKWVPENRAALVIAALTVLRAYVVAGRPMKGKLRASRFAEWSNLIRGALVWLGEPDPLDTQERVSAGDSARADLVALMVAMREAFGGAFKSCGEIIAEAGADDKTGNPPKPLALALGAACPGRGTNTRALGKYLKSKVGRRHEGMWIKAHEDPKNANRYAVMVEADEPRQGELM